MEKTAPWSVSKITVIIPTRDKVEFLRSCVKSLKLKQTARNLQVLILDNQSVQESTLDYFKTEAASLGIRVIPFNEEFNFSRIVNFGVEQAQYETVLILNNDASLRIGGWLDAISEALAQPGVGAIGAIQFSSNGDLRENGLAFFSRGLASGIKISPCNSEDFSIVPATSFAAVAFRKEVFEGIGGLDEQFKEGLNDLDFCVRLRLAGFQIVTNRKFSITHDEFGSRDRPSSISGFMKATIANFRFSWKWGFLESSINHLSLNPSPDGCDHKTY